MVSVGNLSKEIILNTYRVIDEQTAGIAVSKGDGEFVEAIFDLDNAETIAEFTWHLDSEGYPSTFLIDRQVRMQNMVLALDKMRKYEAIAKRRRGRLPRL